MTRNEAIEILRMSSSKAARPGSLSPDGRHARCYKCVTTLRKVVTTRSSEDLLCARGADRVGSIAGAELAEDAARVRLDSLLGEQQAARDLATREAGAEEAEHVDFAL